MSPTVFGYVVLFTLLLSGGAAALEWGTRGRGVARHFWTVAIVLAVVAPGAALTLQAVQARSATQGAAAVVGPPVLARIIINSGRTVAWRGYDFIARDALIRLIAPSRRAVRALLIRIAHDFAAIALVVWVVMSVSMLAWLLVGVFYWRRARHSWRRTTLDGVSIEVSAVTGPAVVGLLSPRIVLPAWATTMQPEHRQLVLAHECEHIDARDPERLMLAIVALILMPWNAALWWCAARLRRAIEIDCDTRVLTRYPGARNYGHVLLEVATRGRNTGPLAIPMVALLRLPSELELRLRAMTGARAVGFRGAIIGGVVAAAAVTTAFATPVPPLRLRASTGGAQTSRRAAPPHARSDTGSKHRADAATQLRLYDSVARLDRAIAGRRTALIDAQDQVDALATRRGALFNRLRATNPRQPSGEKYTTYFSFQVDKPAHLLPTSPTPLYPPSLRRAGVEGEVDAEFVVDTLGHVEPDMVKIRSATNPEFARAVRIALPNMRFAPAEIKGRHIKQVVQQPFTFAISEDQ